MTPAPLKAATPLRFPICSKDARAKDRQRVVS